MKTLFHCLLLVFVLSCQQFKNATKRGPWHNEMQQIPGRIEYEYYDEGGEGVAYLDSDSVNNGSGKLNPANGTFLNEFRMKEGVDIVVPFVEQNTSLTKTSHIAGSHVRELFEISAFGLWRGE